MPPAMPPDMPLNDTQLRKAKPADKPVRLFDGAGLYLEISPAGGKLWRLKYRFEGKEKRLALGKYPEVTLANARERRDEARKLLANGTDPGEVKKVQKDGPPAPGVTFEAVAREWFAYKRDEWVPSHADKILARLERDLFPWIGARPVVEITTPEILTSLLRIAQRGAKDTAKRAQHDCGAIFRFAAVKGYTINNPVDALRRALPAASDGHFAALVDPRDVAALLRAIDGFKGTFVVLCALRLSPLVFVRPGELRHARWADIDLDQGTWQFVVSKQKKVDTKRLHLVPLSTQAVSILRELHALTGEGVYVFPGARDAHRCMSEAAVNAALRRLGYDTKTEMTGHGFRAMARTILHEQLGIAPEVIEHQLAHKVPDTLGTAYNRTKFIEQRRAMMQRWADYLDKLKQGAEVIPLPKQA